MPFPQKNLVFEYYFTDCNNSKIRNWKTAFQKFAKFENGVSKIWNIRKIGRRQMNEAKNLSQSVSILAYFQHQQ